MELPFAARLGLARRPARRRSRRTRQERRVRREKLTRAVAIAIALAGAFLAGMLWSRPSAAREADREIAQFACCAP